MFPLPKQDAPKGKEALLSKNKRKQYTPMNDRDKYLPTKYSIPTKNSVEEFCRQETPTPPLADMGTMKAVSDTKGITW
jgi:hypothetical protein